MLIVSPRPDSFVFTPHRSVVGTTVVMQTQLAASPVVVGMEYRSTQGKAAARTRLGVDPPPPLSASRPGEISVSAPVLLRPSTDGTRPPSSPAAAIPMMLGTTSFPHGSRVGVYWETYGVQSGDTLDVAVRVSQREPPPAPGQPPAPRTGVTPAPGSGITVQWREPDPNRVVTALGGPHPIQARAISLDLSTLQPGNYTLEVSVARPGGAPVSASRGIFIQP
jgi:hypothetical protein